MCPRDLSTIRSQPNFTKIFPGTRNDRPVRDFPKMPHRTFRRISASKPNFIQPTLHPSLYQPA
jgi:hypothetical protein